MVTPWQYGGFRDLGLICRTYICHPLAEYVEQRRSMTYRYVYRVQLLLLLLLLLCSDTGGVDAAAVRDGIAYTCHPGVFFIQHEQHS